MEVKPIVIVGAGITGCVIAYELARRGRKIILVEKEDCVGGLTRTFRYGDFAFDIGPHRFYTNKEKVSVFIQRTLKDDVKIISRNSEVYFLEKYSTWPLRPKVLLSMPLSILTKSCHELFLVPLRKRRRKVENFKDYILEYYGPTLYNIFFKDYTQKFLGLLPEETHFDWAKEAMKRTIIDERMASRNLFDILKLTFMFRPLRTDFLHPSGGIDLFCRRLAEKVKELGGEIWVDALIDGITYSSGEVEELSYNGTVIEPDRVIWTGDLRVLCQSLKMPARGLNYLSLILYNIEINRPIKKDYQWCYYGSSEIVFSRVTIPSRFNKDMAPAGKDSLCVEVTCRENDAWWQNPESLIERIKRDLVKVGLIETVMDIDNIHIENISNAYPIYTQNYPQCLKQVKEALAGIKNLTLAGRTALFWYNNMDDSIENGLKVANDINQGLI